jgi:N-acetylglucosaminyl-diphospho-decaprenol L-rhamnosyltransferase
MTSEDPEFSVIVVAYKSSRVLSRCMDALARQSHRGFEILIVDNGGNDGAVDALEAETARIRVLRPGSNLGFAAANNLAAREAKADWLVMLNPDAFAEPDWLSEISAATRSYPGVAMFGSTQLRADEPDVIDGAGDHYHPLGLAWRGGEGGPAELIDTDTAVFAPCAAAAVYRRDAYDQAGGFAEDFFCYYEDVDLGFRLRLAGESCVQLSRAKVHHLGSNAAGAGSDFIRYHVTRNRIWTFLRCMPGPLFLILFPSLLATLAARLVIAALTGGIACRWRAMADAAAALPRVWAERRLIQSRRRVGSRQVARMMTWSVGKLILRARDARPLPQMPESGDAS